MRRLNLTIENENKVFLIEDNSPGIRLQEIAYEIEDNYDGYIVLASINNKLQELTTFISDDCTIKFLDTNNSDGYRVYSRSLTLVFIMACEELYKNCKVSIEHSLSNGLYCEVHIDRILNENDRKAIKSKMQEIIDSDYKIEKRIVTKNEAIDFFNKHNMKNKAELLKYKFFQ